MSSISESSDERSNYDASTHYSFDDFPNNYIDDEENSSASSASFRGGTVDVSDYYSNDEDSDYYSDDEDSVPRTPLSQSRSMPDIGTITPYSVADEVMSMPGETLSHSRPLSDESTGGPRVDEPPYDSHRERMDQPGSSANMPLAHSVVVSSEKTTIATEEISKNKASQSNKTIHSCPVSGCYHSVFENQIHAPQGRPPRLPPYLPPQHNQPEPQHVRVPMIGGIRYRVVVLSKEHSVINKELRSELLNLELERANIIGNGQDPVIEIETIIQSNRAESEDRTRGPSVVHYPTPSSMIRDPRFDMEITRNDIIVYSRRIVSAFRDIVEYYPGINLTGDVVRLQEPYCFVVHHMDKIKNYGSTAPDKKAWDAEAERGMGSETRDHLEVLSEAVERFYGSKIEDERSRYNRHIPCATFKMLWLLFKPGETVYTKKNGVWQAYVVKGVRFEHHLISCLQGSYVLELWYLDFDGQRLGRRRCMEIIFPFDGEREITSLPVFPAQYIDSHDGGCIRRHLEDRGEKFYHCLGAVQVSYKGNSLSPPFRWHEGRVMIDAASYYSNHTGPRASIGVEPRPHLGVDDRANDQKGDAVMGGGFPGGVSYIDRRAGGPPPPRFPQGDPRNDDMIRTFDLNFPWRNYDDIDPKKVNSLQLEGPEEQARHRYLLCPRRVVGFILQSRRWEDLAVECCSPPNINTNAIDTLVLPEQRKIMIKALVHRYTDRQAIKGKSANPWSADFIENKGEGQIFLLHGGPGVGKTYTAECIAESTGRPLLSLTCGDFGTREGILESRLSMWFKLAESWGAVMLLDEADIFLERRATSDLKRNSLVTVFLRTMEYYRGILFLTTNRVGTFDEAFMSRIHVVIRYDDLDDSDRHKIWVQFFDKLKRERGKDLEIDRQAKKYVLEDPEMASIPWNGREIRNAVQTAVALAEYRFAQLPDDEPGQKACLEWEDFEKVLQMAQAFKGYMYSISEMTESQKAREAQVRNDAFREGKV